MTVRGKVAIVTGASEGIGEATAKLLTEKGASVVLAARSKKNLEMVSRNLLNSYVIASGLEQKGVRWIEEDAMKFVMREGKRGNTYDGIILDPPRFGHGAKGEIWKIEEDLPKLLTEIKKILAPDVKFILLNAYTADLSPIVLHHVLADITTGGNLEFGELALQETSGKRLLPNGIFARWAH